MNTVLDTFTETEAKGKKPVTFSEWRTDFMREYTAHRDAQIETARLIKEDQQAHNLLKFQEWLGAVMSETVIIDDVRHDDESLSVFFGDFMFRKFRGDVEIYRACPYCKHNIFGGRVNPGNHVQTQRERIGEAIDALSNADSLPMHTACAANPNAEVSE